MTQRYDVGVNLIIYEIIILKKGILNNRREKKNFFSSW